MNPDSCQAATANEQDKKHFHLVFFVKSALLIR